MALIDNLRSRSFRFYPLMDDPYCAVVPSGLIDARTHALTVDELLALPFLMGTQNALELLLPRIPENCITVDCDGDETLLTMVQKGLGVTALPQLSAADLPEGVRAIPIVPEIGRILGIALANSPSEPARRFADFLQEFLTADSPEEMP